MVNHGANGLGSVDTVDKLDSLPAHLFETINEAADRTGYASPSTLRQAYLDGHIDGYLISPRLILVLKESVDYYVNSRKNKGGRGKARNRSKDALTK